MGDYTESIMRQDAIPLHIRECVQTEMWHGMQVSNLSKLIAREMRLSLEIWQDVEIAGILHDAGKLKLMRYLDKEESLMVEHMKYVRQHTAQSYEIIMDHGYSIKVAKSVYYHHENYDGTGYPDGLKGENIPFMARILRVCDVFVALTSDRSYRKAFDAKTAMEIMIDEVSNYDMAVFLAFQRVIHQKVMPEGVEMLKKLTSERQKIPLSVFEEEMQKMV